MNADSNTPWGQCAAFGCPCPGTHCSDGRSSWFCFQHFDRDASHRDAITRTLKLNLPVVNAANAIRALHGTKAWEGAEPAISRALRDHGRSDLQRSQDDWGVQGWLKRLDEALLALAIAAISAQSDIPLHHHTSEVIGATSAPEMTPYAD